MILINLSNSLETKTRKIEVKDGLIIYTLTLDGVKDYLSYNEDLLEILKLCKLIPFRDEGRLRFKINESGTSVNLYLYDLALGCYQGMIKSDTLIEDIAEYYKFKSLNSLSVDHIDNNVCNNTAYNLSLMDKGLNMSKGALISKVKMPVYLNSAYVDNKYRVQITFDTGYSNIIQNILDRFIPNTVKADRAYIIMNFICNDAENYVSCLKWLVNNKYEWSLPLKNSKGNWVKNDNPCWCSDINNSLHAQRVLAQMDERDFQLFNQ